MKGVVSSVSGTKFSFKNYYYCYYKCYFNFNFLHYYLSHRLYLFALPYILFTPLQISCMCPWLPKVFIRPGNACELHSGLSFHLYFQIMDFFSEIFGRYLHTPFQHPTPHLFSHCILNTMLCYMLLLFSFLSRRK